MEQRLTSCRTRRMHSGFSLVELLTVVAIIGILTTFGTIAFSSIIRGTNLTSGARLVQSEISLARQQAVTFHQEVEVRFFRAKRHGVVDDPQWMGIQIVMNDSSGTVKPLRRPTLLPRGIVMHEELSTLLSDAPISGSADFGPYGNCTYHAFRFRSGGNTEPALTSANNTLILLPTTADNTSQTPSNFIAVTVNPVNGKTTIFQP